MLCRELLERHSEFRDGLITSSRELRRFARHMAHCTTCRHYDATIRQAVQALHSASPIAPSPDFRQRLDARLAVERRSFSSSSCNARASRGRRCCLRSRSPTRWSVQACRSSLSRTPALVSSPEIPIRTAQRSSRPRQRRASIFSAFLRAQGRGNFAGWRRSPSMRSFAV
jgi:hypothetical protein